MSFLDTLFKKKEEPFISPLKPKTPLMAQATGTYQAPSFLQTLSSKIPVPKVTPSTTPQVDTNKLKETALKLPGELIRGIFTRPAATVVQSLDELTGKSKRGDVFTPTTKIEKTVFGDEPIKSYQQRGGEEFKKADDVSTSVTDTSGAVTYKGIGKIPAYILAIMSTIGIPLGDLTPGGGDKKIAAEKLLGKTLDDIIEKSVKTTTEDEAHILLRKAGIDNEIAKEQAPLIKQATTKNEVKQVLDDTIAKHIQKVERTATERIAELEAKKNGTEVIDQATGIKTPVPPAYLSANELDELQFLKENIKSPEKLTLAYKDNTPIRRQYGVAESTAQRLHPDDIQLMQDYIDTARGVHATTIDEKQIFHLLDKLNINQDLPQTKIANIVEDMLSGKKSVPKTLTVENMPKPKIPKELEPIAKKAENLTRDDFIQQFNQGLKNQNLTKRETAENVKKIMNEVGFKNPGEFYDAAIKKTTKAIETKIPITKERKYITSAKASERVNESIKGQLAGTYDVKTNSALVDRAMGRVANNVEEAKRFALSEATDESIATGTSLVHHYGDEIVNATTKEAKLASASEAANIINKQAEMLTEAGRTVQAASLIGKQTPEGLLVTTARKIKEYNKAHPTKKIAELTAENVVDILEQGRKIEKMPEGLAKNVATKKLADTLESIIPASMWKKFTNIWKAGLLTGVKTSGVNIMSNFFNGFAENVKNIPATGIDFATALFTGKRTKALNLRGLGQGAEEGVKKGWDYLRTGVSGESGESALEFAKVHYNSKPGKLLGAYAESVYRVLGTEDMPFFYGALRRSLGEQALVTIKNEGKVFANSAERSKFIQDFIDNPPKQALDIADLDAKIATFKNDTELGKIANSIRTASPISEIILPFAKTPSAVATAMFNYSPAGAVHTLYRNFIKGPFNQKDFAEGLGRAVTGTAALWLGSQLYKDGKISLEYPTGEKERAQWEATGKIPNAILIDGKWVPLVSFGPAGSILGIGGYVTKGQEETGSLSGGVISGLTGGVKGLTEQTFLTGVKNLMDAINEPSKKGISFVGGTLASIIPTIISDFNSAFDDYQRKSSGTILGPLKARIPGVRETLPKKLDVWGQPLERNRTELGTALSPVRLSNTIQGKLNTEVERLGMLGEDIRPTKVDSTISGVKLDDAEYYKYQRLYGNIATKALSTLIDNKEYQQLDPENQAKEWKKAVNEIRGAVSDAILPALLSKRYNLPENVDMQAVTELTIDLYKKFPDFAKAPPEKQRKVILKLLKIEEPQSENKPNPTSFLKDIFTTKTAYAAEITQAPVVSNTTFIHQNKPVDINEIKRQVAFRESGISKDPYKTVGKATGDLGKYQVNPTTLAENSQRFLGKKITPEEFLNSPADQEKFFERAMEKFKTSFGVKNLDTALILWHRGFGNISSKRIAKLKQDPEVKQYLANRPPK